MQWVGFRPSPLLSLRILGLLAVRGSSGPPLHASLRGPGYVHRYQRYRYCLRFPASARDPEPEITEIGLVELDPISLRLFREANNLVRRRQVNVSLRCTTITGLTQDDLPKTRPVRDVDETPFPLIRLSKSLRTLLPIQELTFVEFSVLGDVTRKSRIV
jgi:hypothetical protein